MASPNIKVYKQNGYNFLWIDNYLWMWDIPVERQAQKEIADKAYGDVLVAGYGFGLVQKFLLKNPHVTSVTTIEQYPKIITIAKKLYRKIYGDVIISDFYAFRTKHRFDCVIGDIWEDVMPAGLPEYRKFKKKAKTLLKPRGSVLAWGQDFFEYLIKKKHGQG